MATEIIPAADFQALPIEMLIATPLVATVKAQAAAAESTLAYIKGMMKADGGGNTFTPESVSFKLGIQDNPGGGGSTRNVQLDVPLLSMVPVPHLRIDSLTTHFRYEITQVVADKTATEKGGELGAGLKWLPFVEATLKGTVSSRSSEESTTNRSGMMEISVHASEAPIPEGLARLLSLLATMAEPKPV